MSAVRKDRSMDSSSGGWLTYTGSVPVGDAISIFTVGKSVAFNPPFDLATAASAAAGVLYCLYVAPLAPIIDEYSGRLCASALNTSDKFLLLVYSVRIKSSGSFIVAIAECSEMDRSLISCPLFFRIAVKSTESSSDSFSVSSSGRSESSSSDLSDSSSLSLLVLLTLLLPLLLLLLLLLPLSLLLSVSSSLPDPPLIMYLLKSSSSMTSSSSSYSSSSISAQDLLCASSWCTFSSVTLASFDGPFCGVLVVIVLIVFSSFFFRSVLSFFAMASQSIPCRDNSAIAFSN